MISLIFKWQHIMSLCSTFGVQVQEESPHVMKDLMEFIESGVFCCHNQGCRYSVLENTLQGSTVDQHVFNPWLQRQFKVACLNWQNSGLWQDQGAFTLEQKRRVKERELMKSEWIKDLLEDSVLQSQQCLCNRISKTMHG